ncbi:hypothetical protein DV706_20255 (plasmid) [Natronorubrum bangense]|uniref:Uncharacterized protein n=1 Tax=Natronorubrum bangense TaxID=61858 RepID=A0A4D6HVH5_9EURY|nr:hypothetical protein DV706_20255 [Natronorubrum bangense]
MPVNKYLHRFLQSHGTDEDNPDTILYECRHCGSKFDDHRDMCPTCGRTEFATYNFTELESV